MLHTMGCARALLAVCWVGIAAAQNATANSTAVGNTGNSTQDDLMYNGGGAAAGAALMLALGGAMGKRKQIKAEYQTKLEDIGNELRGKTKSIQNKADDFGRKIADHGKKAAEDSKALQANMASELKDYQASLAARDPPPSPEEQQELLDAKSAKLQQQVQEQLDGHATKLQELQEELDAYLTSEHQEVAGIVGGVPLAGPHLQQRVMSVPADKLVDHMRPLTDMIKGGTSQGPAALAKMVASQGGGGGGGMGGMMGMLSGFMGGKGGAAGAGGMNPMGMMGGAGLGAFGGMAAPGGDPAADPAPKKKKKKKNVVDPAPAPEEEEAAADENV